MKEKMFEKTKNHLLRILKNNSKKDLDLKEDENLTFDLENFEINEDKDSHVYCINFTTTFGQRGFYKLVTDTNQNFKDEFFVIL